MIINTAGVVAYNKKLKQAVPETKLGANNGVNTDTEKAALKLMAGGPSKINPPNSHPSNTVYRAAQQQKIKPPVDVNQKEPAVDVTPEKEP